MIFGLPSVTERGLPLSPLARPGTARMLSSVECWDEAGRADGEDTPQPTSIDRKRARKNEEACREGRDQMSSSKGG